MSHQQLRSYEDLSDDLQPHPTDLSDQGLTRDPWVLDNYFNPYTMAATLCLSSAEVVIGGFTLNALDAWYFFTIFLLSAIFSGIPSECHTVWIQFKPETAKSTSNTIVAAELMPIELKKRIQICQA